MGINKLILSPEIIASLYPEALVSEKAPDSAIIPAKSGKPDSKPVADYPYLGKNLRSLCFLVDYPNEQFITEPQLTFITKMLAACKYSIDDIAIVNIAHRPVQLSVLKSQLKPEILFFWGVSPSQTGMKQQSLPELEISTIENLSIIPVPNPLLMIKEGAEGIEMKQRLWVSLKKLFNL